MKYVLRTLLLGAFSASNYSVGEIKSSEQQYIFASPVLSAAKVVELSEEYIKKTKRVNLDDYYLSSVSFGYYYSDDENVQDNATWFVSYDCKPTDVAEAIGCDFSLSVSNSKSPKIVFYPGR